MRKTLRKVAIASRRDISEVRNLLMDSDFKIVEKDPDFIVCYGGDGTVLFAERTFPRIPKLIVKESHVCRKCDYTLQDLENVLRRIKEQKYKMRRAMKLEGRFQAERLIGLNEIQVHTKLPTYAVRFSVTIDGTLEEFDNLIGDGVVVATPFGSTGYYKSTGGTPFGEGMGISFNNLHNEKIKSFVISEDATVRVRINRGPAWIMADNNENFVELDSNDTASIRKAAGVANFIYMG